jgi:hypothetical protein
MKRKVDLLAVALAEQSSWLWHSGHDRGRSNPHGWCQCPWNSLTKTGTKVRLVCILSLGGTGKMNVPNGPGTPRRLPRPESEAEFLKESIGLLRGEVVPGRKT